MDQDIQQLLSERRYDEALEQLVDRYRHKVFRLAVAMLRDPGLAEETAQEVFLKIWRALPGYNGQASLSTWLYAIARNTCLSQIRYRRLRVTVTLEEPAARTASARQPDSGYLDVRRHMEELPEVQRQVLALFYLQEKSYDDVAALLDMPVGTVKSHLHRARRALADRLR